MALTTLFVCFLPLHSKFFPCNDHVTDFWLGLNLHLFPKGTRRPGLVASAAKAAGQPYPSPPSDREARRGFLQSSLPRWAFSRHDVAPGAPLQSHLPPPSPTPTPASSVTCRQRTSDPSAEPERGRRAGVPASARPSAVAAAVAFSARRCCRRLRLAFASRRRQAKREEAGAPLHAGGSAKERERERKTKTTPVSGGQGRRAGGQ